jgi:hypothetical protein
MSTFRMDTTLRSRWQAPVAIGCPAQPILTLAPAWRRAALACLDLAQALRAGWQARRSDSLVMLDTRTLADLGLDRSDIASIEAERRSQVEPTRRHRIHRDLA